MILAFPLYVHAMPGLVKHFVESLIPREPIHDVPLGFIVQSGFPEGHPSRWLEAERRIQPDFSAHGGQTSEFGHPKPTLRTLPSPNQACHPLTAGASPLPPID